MHIHFNVPKSFALNLKLQLCKKLIATLYKLAQQNCWNEIFYGLRKTINTRSSSMKSVRFQCTKF